ncbi:MAG: hypothetical protein IPO63_17855 [Bacteroidetes bacterium]|nr:hypothetical protein [Bacteroidota bacterium]
MKFFLSLLLASTLVISTATAQVPQGISYQAIAFNAGGAPVVNGNVGVKISILDNSISGSVVYSETHTKPTNAQGLFNLNIGQGSPTTGTFSTINWATYTKFLKVEIDPNGGTNYVIVGINQLMSVPYALYSENTNSGNISGLSNLSSTKNGTMLVVYTSSNAYGFTVSSGGNPTWYSQSLSGTPIGAIATDSSIVVYTNSNAYGFTSSSGGNPTWYAQSLSGTPTGITSSGNTIVVYTSSNSYGFTNSSGGNPTWYAQSLSGTPIGTTVNGKDCIVVYTSSNAYGFMTSSGGNPSWYAQSLSGTPIGGSASGQFIVIYTSSNSYGFTRASGGSPTWYSQSLSGTPAGIVPK